MNLPDSRIYLRLMAARCRRPRGRARPTRRGFLPLTSPKHWSPIMRKMTPALALFALAAVAAFAAPAHAQPTRTWVSGVGVDSGTCPRQTPCHTFSYAHG